MWSLMLLCCSLFITGCTSAMNIIKRKECAIQSHMDVLVQSKEIFTEKAMEFFPKHYIVYLLGMKEHFSNKFIDQSGLFMISYRNEAGREYQVGTGKFFHTSDSDIECIFNGHALPSNSIGKHVAVSGYKKIMQRHGFTEEDAAANKPK